jgi:hypothetical protein
MLWFLDIILRVLILEVSVLDILNHREGGMVFYQVLLLSPLQRLCELKKKIEISSKAVKVTVNNKEENLKTFSWILSKNAASGQEKVKFEIICHNRTRIISSI